jgi:hypothetical protein
MKLDLQTVADVFANRLGNNNRRVMSAPEAPSGFADFQLTGAILRVTVDQHLVTEFTITQADELGLTRAELADKYADPAVEAIKTQFDGSVMDYVVSASLPITRENQAIASSNNVNVRVSTEAMGNDTKYTLEVLLGTFSI